MEELLPSTRHNLARLVTFRGRDSKRQFWPWAILVFLIQCIAGIAIMIPWMAGTMNRVIAVVQTMPGKEAQDQQLVAAKMEALLRESMAGIGDLWLPSLICQLGAVLLIAASVTRRLHDRNRRGYWGLIPLPFVAISIANLPIAGKMMTGDQMTPLEGAAVALGYGYWIALLVLVVILVGDGDKGPNRFGAQSGS
ncbi:MAG: DUF805 domain-containing protein [Allosphingosinicella sp.]